MSDRDLADEVELSTWEETYRRHADHLIRLATMLVGPDDAEDVVVEAVGRVVGSQTWSTVADPGAFLARSVINAATSLQRSDQRRRTRDRRWALEPRTSGLNPTNDDEVRVALSSLSDQQRAVVFLAYWEDLSIGEIARWLDVTEGTVRRQLDRAKRRLREVLR